MLGTVRKWKQKGSGIENGIADAYFIDPAIKATGGIEVGADGNGKVTIIERITQRCGCLQLIVQIELRGQIRAVYGQSRMMPLPIGNHGRARNCDIRNTRRLRTDRCKKFPIIVNAQSPTLATDVGSTLIGLDHQRPPVGNRVAHVEHALHRYIRTARTGKLISDCNHATGSKERIRKCRR